eukprot:764954-Hanusia_phi.AAC.5
MLGGLEEARRRRRRAEEEAREACEEAQRILERAHGELERLEGRRKMLQKEILEKRRSNGEIESKMRENLHRQEIVLQGQQQIFQKFRITLFQRLAAASSSLLRANAIARPFWNFADHCRRKRYMRRCLRRLTSRNDRASLCRSFDAWEQQIQQSRRGLEGTLRGYKLWFHSDKKKSNTKLDDVKDRKEDRSPLECLEISQVPVISSLEAHRGPKTPTVAVDALNMSDGALITGVLRTRRDNHMQCLEGPGLSKRGTDEHDKHSMSADLSREQARSRGGGEKRVLTLISPDLFQEFDGEEGWKVADPCRKEGNAVPRSEAEGRWAGGREEGMVAVLERASAGAVAAMNFKEKSDNRANFVAQGADKEERAGTREQAPLLASPVKQAASDVKGRHGAAAAVREAEKQEETQDLNERMPRGEDETPGAAPAQTPTQAQAPARAPAS